MDVVGFFSEKDKVSFDWSFEKSKTTFKVLLEFGQSAKP